MEQHHDPQTAGVASHPPPSSPTISSASPSSSSSSLSPSSSVFQSSATIDSHYDPSSARDEQEHTLISPPEAPRTSHIPFATPTAPSEPLQQQQRLSTDKSSLLSSSASSQQPQKSPHRPSLTSSSRRPSSIQSFSKIFGGNRRKSSLAEPQTRKPRPANPFDKLSFTDRLTWVLDQSFGPSRPTTTVHQQVPPKRVIVQRQIPTPSSITEDTAVAPLAEQNEDQIHLTEKILVESGLDPADPDSQLVVAAPVQDEVACPFTWTAPHQAVIEQDLPYFPDPLQEEQDDLPYDGDYDDEYDQEYRRSLADSEFENNVSPTTVPTHTGMDLARALHRRVRRSESSTARPRISLPVNLISSTNMAYLNGPKVTSLGSLDEPQSADGGSSGEGSSPTSVRSSTDKSTGSIEPALTDASSVGSESPVERNHLTQYFEKSPRRYSQPLPSTGLSSKPLPQEPRIAPTLPEEIETEDFAAPAPTAPPAIPRRAPSHSKREHVRLARVRSIRSSTSSMTSSRLAQAPHSHHSSLTPSVSSSSDLVAAFPTPPTAQQQHPFSNELEQLNEVAEEFSNGAVSRQVERAEDDHVMLERGLARLGIEDYMTEVSNPWGSSHQQHTMASPDWV